MTSGALNAERIGATVGRTVRHHWQLFLMEGIALVVLGLLAIAAPVFASLAATIFFGWLLIISGGVGLVATLRARRAPDLSGRWCRRPWDWRPARCWSCRRYAVPFDYAV